MLIQREWNDEKELFETIVEALDASFGVLEDADADWVQCIAHTERDSYGNDGTIELRTRSGRCFKLTLSEEV